MKQVAIFAGLAAFAAANHHAHQHHHEHVRRGADGTVTSWDITTEVTVVTTTVFPGQDPGSSANPPAAAPSDASGKADDVNVQAVSTGAPAAAAAAPTSSYDPNAVQASYIAEQSSKDAVQEAANSRQMSINNAPQTGVPAPAPTQQPQPTQAQSQPAQSQPPAPSGSSSPDGDWHVGYGTYYGAEGGYGSCGQQLSDSGHTVALNEHFMKQSCGKTITIQIGVSGQTVQATVADTCPGCIDSDGHIDIVQDWAFQLDPNIQTNGSTALKWKFN